MAGPPEAVWGGREVPLDVVEHSAKVFSAPHVSGAVALLTQRHPSWTPEQMKSALMSTAGPSFADTAGTQEASVIVEGAGLVRVGSADRPLIFTDPQSLSFGYLVAGGGANSKTVSVTLSDAGDGAGTWTTEIQSQVASSGATLEAAPVTLAPGGTAVLQITARAAAGAAQGDDFGFILLRRGGDVRRIPYAFSVSHSSLADAAVTPLKPIQSGDTRSGDDRVRVYRWPTSPFSILGLFGVDPAVNEDGKEKVYSLDITKQATNAGVVVVRPAPSLNGPVESLFDSNQPIHPWFMGSLDENDVLGYAGIPVNVNSTLPDFLFSKGPRAASSSRRASTTSRVDSGRDPFTGKSLAGPYTLRSWVNDVKPPVVKILTQSSRPDGRPSSRRSRTRSRASTRSRCSSTSGRPGGSPRSRRPSTTRARVSPPSRSRGAPTGCSRGRSSCSSSPPTTRRAKNISAGDTSANPLPNTQIGGLRAVAVNRPTVTWATPGKNACASRRQELLVVANDNVPDLVRRVLRRQAPDRPRPQEHRRAVSHDVAPAPQGRPRPYRGRVRRARTRRAERLRPFASAADCALHRIALAFQYEESARKSPCPMPG